jgi:hypothetical protein
MGRVRLKDGAVVEVVRALALATEPAPPGPVLAAV